MSDDRDIENILEDSKKPKKIKSGQKGKRVERELCKHLNKRFADILAANRDWGTFTRSVGSGNRWGQGVHLSKAAKDTFSGDISVPTNFKFVLESKGGYNDIDLCSAFDGGNSELDGFLKQVSDDADRSERMPMLVWKKDRKPRLAFLRAEDLDVRDPGGDYCMSYREWKVYNLEDILTLADDFFFDD